MKISQICNFFLQMYVYKNMKIQIQAKIYISKSGNQIKKNTQPLFLSIYLVSIKSVIMAMTEFGLNSGRQCQQQL